MMEPMSPEGQRRLGTVREEQKARGVVGVWDPSEQPGQAPLEEGREGENGSTDRLMAPAMHTIEFALLSLPALGEGLSSWELSWTPRATGPGPARPDWIRRNEGRRAHRQPGAQRGWWWLSPER